VQGERVLLLASTNLAVDNALTAILKEGVAKEKVLRIGLPSEEFRLAHPECCDERAVQHRTAEITSHIRELEQQVESISRVFIDEAPYAPLAKVLPVLSLHRPIALLGDHYQLPPVCEVQDNASICAYWGKPSIFLEDAFSLGNEWDALNKLDEARNVVLPRHILRTSYRFGPTLASLLDRHVYHNGLQGQGGSNTSIECVHCEPFDRPNRKKRENDSEADEIVRRVERWWDWVRQQPDVPGPRLAILTPYIPQRKLIEVKLKARFGIDAIRDHVEVLNTHQAQGREWEYVFFSASDTRRLVGNGPWFSDSTTPVGRALVNTTLSRARKYLYVFFDKSDWRNRQPDSILTELAVTGGVAKGHALMEV